MNEHETNERVIPKETSAEQECAETHEMCTPNRSEPNLVMRPQQESEPGDRRQPSTRSEPNAGIFTGQKSEPNRIVSIDDIVVDRRFQVRAGLDEAHIERLCEVLRSGRRFRDPLVLTQNMELVAGFHRLEAYRRVRGDMSSVPVEIRHFADEYEAYEFAGVSNITHGKRLDESELRMFAETLRERRGYDRVKLSAILSVSQELLSSWSADVVVVANRVRPGVTTRKRNPGPSAPASNDPAGATTRKDKQAPTGTTALFHARRLLHHIYDMELNDQSATIEILKELRSAITNYLRFAKKG